MLWRLDLTLKKTPRSNIVKQVVNEVIKYAPELMKKMSRR